MKKPFGFKSFVFAFRGLKLLWQEANFRVHLLITILVLLLSFLLNISKSDFLIVLLCIGIVLFAEAVNTAIEKLCDVVQPEKDSRIKNIKDISAAAVLISSVMAAITGLIIFIPYITSLL